MQDAQVKKGLGAMVRNGSLLKLLAVLTVFMAAGSAFAASFTLNGAGTAKAGDTITFTTDNTWLGTSINTTGNATEIRYLNAGGTLVAGIPLTPANVAAWTFNAGAITGGSFVLPAQLDVAITQVELQITTNAEGPILSLNRRAVDVTAPTAQTTSVANGGIIGGTYNFVVQDNGAADNDVVGAGVVVQIDNGTGTFVALPSQTPGAWTGGVGSTVVIDFDAIDANNNGFIEEVTTSPNGSVLLRIVVSDPAGNSAILGPFTNLTVDALRPTVLSITTVTTTTIRIVYSEEVGAATSTNIGNYALSVGVIAPGGAALSQTTVPNDTVTLTLTSAISSSATPTVTVTNVRDLGTNIISANAPNGTPATDGIRPTLLSAKLNTYAGQNTILLEFDEPIQAGVLSTQLTVGAGDISNIGALTQNPGGLGTQFFQFDNATANTPLVAGTTIAAQVSILDIAGNTANTGPVTLQLLPSVQSATYTAADGAGQYTLTVNFSKTINRASFVSALANGDLRLSRADGTTGQFVVDSTNSTLVTATDAAAMVLKLSPSADASLVTFNGLGLIKLQLVAGIVSDGALLSLAATGTDITVGYTADVVAPLLDVGNPIIQRKLVEVTGTTVDITFDDYVTQASVTGASFLLNGVTAATSATVLTTGTLAGYSVRLVFAAGVDVDVLDGTAVAADLDVAAGVIANNNALTFAGTVDQVIATDAAATSTITQGAAPASTTLVAATVHGAEANVFNFTVTDAGADNLPTNFTSIQLEITDLATFNAANGNITWRLSGGSLGAPVVGVVGGASPSFTLTFSGLAQSVANGTAANYAVSVQVLAAANIADGSQFRIARIANNSHLVSTGGSTFVAAVGFNGSTMTYDVVATKLAFTTVDGGGVGSFPASTAFAVNKAVNTDFGSFVLEFVDANNLRDLGANGAGAQVTVSNSAGVAPAFAGTIANPAAGQVDPVNGVVTFNAGTAIRFSTTANDISLAFATAYAPAGAIANATTTGTFDVRPDNNSTLTETGSPATINDTGTATTVWELSLADLGTADALATVLNSLTINATMGGTAGLNLSNFVWTLIADDDGAGGGAARAPVTAVGPAATSGALIFTAAPLISVANGTTGTLVLQVNTVNVTASAVLDGITFDFQVATAAAFAFETSGDLAYPQNSSMVALSTTRNNTTNTAIDVVASQLAVVTQPAASPANQVVGVAFSVAAQYVNARGNRDLGVAGDVLTAKRANTGGAVVGSGAAASGLATFNVTFAAPGDISNTLRVHFEDDVAGVDLSAPISHITSNVFLLRNTDDANSTITSQSVAAAITSIGGAQDVWTMRLTDTGLSDGKTTVLTGMTFLVGMAGGGTNDVGDFDWTIFDGVTTYTGTPNNGTDTVTFSSMTITAPGTDTTGGNIDFSLRAAPATTVTDRANLDGMTLNFLITAATTSIAGTSLNAVTPFPAAPTANVIIQVAATRLSFNPTGFNSITNPTLAGTPQTIEVWYTDTNGNLDKNANGAGFTVTAARSDSFGFFPDPNPSLEGIGNDTLSIQVVAAGGVASFSAGSAINLAGRASPATNITVNFTDGTTFATGTGAAATPLASNTFLLNSRQEAALSAGIGAEDAAFSSVGAAAELLDFTVTDGGNDDINTRITSVTLDLSTSTSGAGNINGMLGDVDFRMPIQGSLTAVATGTVVGTTVVFDLTTGGNTGIVIADGTNATYRVTIQAKATKFTVARDGDIFRASLAQTTSFAVDAQYGRMSAGVFSINNGAGATLNVVATRMAWINALVDLPTSIREGDLVRDAQNAPLAIEYVDLNGNRDLGATDVVSVFWSGIADATQAAEVRADGATNTLAAVAGLATFTNFSILDNGAGPGVGGLNGNLFFVDGGAGVLAGAGVFTSPNLAGETLNTDALRLSNAAPNTFHVRAIDDKDTTFVVANVAADIPVGGGEVEVFRVTFTDTGASDNKATVVKELRFDVVLSGGGIDATNFAWRISHNNGGTFTASTGATANRVSFVSAGSLFSIADSGNGNPTNVDLRLYATALTTAGNINGKTAADNQTLTISLDPAAGVGGNGVVFDSGAAAFVGTSLSAGQALVTDPGNDTVRVTATQLVFASYTGGVPAGDGSASMLDHQLGVQGGAIGVEFRDAANNRDLDSNGAGFTVAAARSDVGAGFTVTNGSLVPASGVATFNLTFDTQRAGWTITNQANQINLSFTQGALTAATTNNFNVQSDATSTITEVAAAATLVDDSAFQTVWTLNVNDLGSFDGLPTILDSIVLTGAVSGGFSLTNFNWRASFNGGPNVTPTVTGTTLTFAGPTLMTVANNTSATIVLQAQTGLVTNSTTFDGITIDLTATAASTQVLDNTNSSTFAAFPAVNNTTNTVVNVVADRVVFSGTVFPGDGNTPNVPLGEERVNVVFTSEIFYQNTLGNRDTGVNGDIVTVVRSDAGGVNQGTSAAAVNGVALFTAANSINLANPANVTNTLVLTASDDPAGGSVLGVILSGDSPAFILRTFDDANSRIEETAAQAGNNTLFVMTTGTNTALELWRLDVTDLETSDPVPTIVEQLIFNVGIANAGTNTINDIEWTLQNDTQTFVGAANVGLGTITFQSAVGSAQGPLVQAGDANLATNGTPDTKVLRLFGRVKTPGNGGSVTDPANIDGATLTISLGAIAGGPPTVYDDGNAANNEDSTSFNTAFAPISGPLNRTAGIVTVQVIATAIRELPAAMVTGTNRSSNVAFALGAEYVDVNNYRDRDVNGDTVTVVREDGTNLADPGNVTNPLPVSAHPFKGAGVIISGGTANAVNGVANFTINLGYPGFLATDAGHRLFFVDNDGGSIDLFGAEGAGQPYTTGQFALDGQNEATIAAGLGAESASVSSTAAGPAVVVDFQIIDNGADALSTDITQITINVGGTAQPNEGVWYMDGPDFTSTDFNGAANRRAVGVQVGNQVTFGVSAAAFNATDTGALPIRVGDNTGTVAGLQSETYRILFQPTAGNLTTQDNQFWTVTVDSLNFVFDDVAGSGRQASVTVDNTGVGGLRYDVTATTLSFGALSGPGGAPTGSTVAGVNFALQPDFRATDIHNNRDLDFNNTITAALTTNPGASTIAGTNPVSFTAGIAAFTDLNLNKVGTGYRFTFSSGALPPLQSPLFDITAAPAFTAEISTQPSNAVAGTLLPTGPVVRLLDAFGNIATATVATTFTATITTPAGGTNVFDSNDAGPTNFGTPVANRQATVGVGQSTATFNNIRLNRAATGYALAIAATVNTNPVAINTALFNVTPGAAASVSVSPTFADPHLGNVNIGGVAPAGATAGAAFTTQPVAVLLDVFGNVRTNDSATQVVATIDAPGGTYTGPSVAGLANNANVAGTLQGLNSQTVTVVNGVASFAGIGLRIDQAASNYTLRFADVGAQHPTAATSVITVLPAVGTLIQIEEAPINAVAGAAIAGANTAVPVGTIRLSIRDSFGNVRTNDSTTVISAAIGANPGSATLFGTTSRTVAQGVANFPADGTGINIQVAGTGYTLNFSSGGLATATSTAFNITPAVASQFVIQNQPTNINAGVAFLPSPSLMLRDTFGNNATNDSTSVVRLSLANNPGLAGLRLTSALGTTLTHVDGTAVNGVVTFNNVTLDKAANGYTLNFAGITPVIAGTNSSAFNVNAGAPSQLAMAVQPGNTVAGFSITPAPQLQVRDQFGNHVTSDNTTTVTAAVGIDPNSASTTFGGNTSATASGGTVTFNNLFITRSGVGYRADFTSGTVTGVNSNLFNITHAPAASIEITTQPGNTNADSVIPGIPTIRLLDIHGNIATSDNSTVVSVSIGTDPSSGAANLAGTLSKPVTNGVATFANLIINKKGVGYTLTFTGTGLTSAGTNAFNVVAGAPHHLQIAVQPANGTAGGPFGQPRLEVYDINNNLTDNNSTVNVTAAISANPGAASLSGSSTTTIQVTAGVADWSLLPLPNRLRIDRASSGYSLLFTATAGVTSVTSNTFNIGHAAAAQLALTTQPNGSTAGQSFNVQPVVEVRDAFDNRVTSDSISVVSVGFVLDGPGGATGNPVGNANGVLQGPPSQPVTAGIATFTLLRIDQAGVGYRLRFASGALTVADSNTFNVNHAAPSQLVVTTQPAGAFGGANFTTQPVVEIRDPFNNVATTSSLTVNVGIGSDPTGGTSGFAGGPSLAATAGVVDFANLPVGNRFRINKAANGYTLAFNASGLPTANSAPFNVLVGPAASIHMVTQPDGFRATIAGVVQTLDTQPAVELRDLGGNKVIADNTTVVTAAIGVSAPVTGVPVLGGTLARTAVNGDVTWTDLSISVAGDYTLVFTGAGLVQAESAVFTLESGPLVLQTIALDDHDNNGQVSARDRLLFVWDEELLASSVPLVNTTGQLDAALGLANGALGANATAVINPDGRSIWVTVGAGETVSAGTTTSNPTTIRNSAGDLDVTPAPIAIGGAVTDTFAPRLLSLTINGGSPAVLAAGTYEIVASYTDDQVNPTITIVAPGTNDVTNAVMTAVDAANPRVFRYEYTIGTANGTFYVDGPVTFSVSNANDARGNVALDEVGLPYSVVVDTVDPVFTSLAVTDADNCYRTGDTISVQAVMNEVGLTLQGFFGGADTAFNAPITFTDNLNGSYSVTTPALSATSVEGTHQISVVATDIAGNTATFFVIVEVDNTAPTAVFSYNRPVTNVPAGDLVIAVTYNEDIYVRPVLNASFAGNSALNITGQPMGGSVPGRTFSFTMTVDAGTADTVTLTIGDAADCAGNLAASPANNILTLTGGAATLVANAGPDQMLHSISVVTLNGTSSIGATGYSWTRLSGPQAVTITNANQAIATFSATAGGDYVFELEVTNGTDVATDVVTVSIPNFMPVVTVGADVNTDANEVNTGIGGTTAKVSLSATVLDRNNDSVVTQWVLVSGPTDGNLTIASPGSLTTSLNVTGTTMVGGVYEYELRAWDPLGLLNATYGSARLRFVVVSATRIAPTAHAGLNQTVNVGNVVHLTGNESSDPNAAVPSFPALIYSWSITTRPAGSVAILSNTSSKTPTFVPDLAGVYVASLTVTDAESLKSGTATVVITAIPAPVAGSQAGMVRATVSVNHNDTDTNGAINVGEQVTMDASSSPTANPLAVLTFNWVQIDGPAPVVLTNANGAIQSFTATVAGNYTFVVTPNDGLANGISATVKVTVAPAGQAAPTAVAAIDAADDIDSDKRVFFVPGFGVDINAGNPSIEITGEGSSTGLGVTYQWRQVEGPTVGIVNANSLVMSFTPRLSRVYAFELTVTQGGVSSTAVSTITIDTYHPVLNPTGNLVPSAVAQSLEGTATILTTAGRTVAMFGIGNDGNDENSNLIYMWVQTKGAPVVLVGANTANPTFVPPVAGLYEFALYVDDGADIGQPSMMTVQVGPFVPAPTDPGAVGSSGCSMVEGSNTGLWTVLAALMALAALAVYRRRRA